MIRNSVRLTGRIGNKVEVKVFEGNKKMARLSLATNESRKNQQGEWITDTQWHNIVAWGKQADFFETKTDKGTEVSIEGRLINRSYTDKQGTKKYITEIVVNEVNIPAVESNLSK
ncbi:single-stranded DNA-binding protein [Anditalea andensis]|uniref:Single-stranded DNA-binding protein n=1 Tax=Anditalea andensis TaxID=1048983 RepID=A0A074L263_9BACT|nr:single-stranded DNA-binding protein [Anditalea andensis]KEO74560.1 single-stranded DNA-binding protein [Anditalea andensis]